MDVHFQVLAIQVDNNNDLSFNGTAYFPVNLNNAKFIGHFIHFALTNPVT